MAEYLDKWAHYV